MNGRGVRQRDVQGVVCGNLARGPLRRSSGRSGPCRSGGRTSRGPICDLPISRRICMATPTGRPKRFDPEVPAQLPRTCRTALTRVQRTPQDPEPAAIDITKIRSQGRMDTPSELIYRNSDYGEKAEERPGLRS
jgi:hypothetical protein